MSEAFERLRDSLHNHGSKITDNKQHHFKAQCPAHEDGNPSLGVDDKGDRVMVRCYAGCNTDDVMAELGLELRDLFDGEPDKDRALPVRSYVYETLNGEPWIIKDRYFPKTFVQRLPGTQPGDRTGLKGRAPILYRAPKLWRHMRSEEFTRIYVVDGEKDVESIEKAGGLATCAPGGAGARWRDEFTRFLREADEVLFIADQDKIKANGDLGTGQQYALAGYTACRGAGIKSRVLAPAVGKDASDHLMGGYGLGDFVPEPSVSIRPRGMTAPVLMAKEFEPLNFAIEGILPAGLTIFAGSPKAGKSWAALDFCLAVASGGVALSHLSATLGSALYLAREDSYRRLQDRINVLLAGTVDTAPPKLELLPAEHEWNGGEQSLANMTEWAEEVGDPMLVVLDTLQKVEPDMGEERRGGNAYTGNYSMMTRYKDWADRHNCAVVMIHHDRKQGSTGKESEQDDPFTRISGTRGLTGAADTLMFLETKRGTREGRLHITGRDVAEQTLDLMKSGPTWVCLDDPEEV